MKPMIIIVCLVLVLFVFMSNRDKDFGVQTTADGLLKHTDDFEVRLTEQAPLFENFMIFGGHIDHKLSNSFSDYSLGALAIDDAAEIRQKYPDFHLCQSPGAVLAKNKIRNLSLIMHSPAIAEVVEDAIDLHDERLHAGGERTCIELRGSQVKPVTVVLRENGMDISSDVIPKLHNMQYFLINGAEIRDCLSLL